MNFQKFSLKSTFRGAATSIFFLAALSGIAHGEVFLNTGFEDSSSLPDGWTQSTQTGTATWSIQSGGQNGGSNPSSAYSGANNATLYRANTSDNKTRLISPTFDTTGFINISLDFWHIQGLWEQDQDELKVLFSNDGGSTWTELAYFTENVPNWTQRTLTIPSASADSRIAFEGNAKYGYGVCLDDIEVSGIPDTFSEVFVSATDADASEVGLDTGTWTITRTGNTSGALSVNYSLGGAAVVGSDYTLDSSNPINFAAGETSKVVTLTPIDDALGEGDEVATLTLTEGTGYAVGDAAGDISIYDDEGAERNILVVGSTRSFSDGGEQGVVQEKAFNPSSIATYLDEILGQDPLLNESVDVTFEDIFKTKFQTVRYDGSSSYDFVSHCYSLAQHYMWPEGKAERLANLRGEGDTEWDTIVLCADPYILANFPGMYAEGVKLIQNEVAQSANPAQIVLLAQWPENSSSFSAEDFNEVVHRVGDSAGLTVVPAGKAWDSYTSQDASAAHPTPKGAYLAAASIYSKLYDRSAKTSGYDFPAEGDAIADHALSVVQANTGVAQYTGAYTSINPFQMKYVTKRVVNFRETGTSTEDRIRFALNRLDDVQRINFSTSGYSGESGTRWDFNYGRGNDWWEDPKDYEVDPGKYDRSYGFPMHHYTTSSAPTTMPYGIDKHYWNGASYEDGTDLGIAYNMIRPGTRELGLPEDVRAIPIRLMWLKMREISPGFNPLGDNTHMGPHLNDATAAFMYTLLSGRCPVVEEPANEGSTEWMQWLGHKVGYETAWQMAHLTTRAPGFRVLPSSTSATTVSPTATETMTVQFANPPQEDVTVTVSVSSPTAAIVSPKTLVFTPSNHNTPQEVTVAGVPGATASEPFEVRFSTSSDDNAYDGLSDAWAYTNNRSSTEAVSQVDNGTTQVITPQYTAVDIALNVAGADAGNTTFAGPSNGSIAWTGTGDIQYTPDGDFLGSDQIVYAVTLGGTQTIGSIDISVQLPDGQVNASAGDATAAEEGPDDGTFILSRLGDTTEALDVFFSLGGTADIGADYTLSHTSPVTIPAGQESVMLTLTPVDDAVFGEREETVVLSIMEDAAYPIGLASATITIADNDNNAPTADAGVDQSAELEAATTTPGLYYGTVPGNIDESTPNPETQILVDVSSETENSIAGNTTEIYTGSIYDADGQISFTEHIDDKARIWIDDVLVLSNDVWGTRSSTANLNLAPGWHSIEIRISNGSGGSGPVDGVGIGYDPAGGTAWQPLVDPGDGSFLRVDEVSGVAVNLTGSVDDVNGDPLVTTWTVESGPGEVTIADASALATTATFTEIGTYVLRLTVDDGYDQSFDELTITVDNVSDTTPPTLVGADIIDDQGGVDVIEGSLVTYTVTFSEDMDAATVDASDFTNAGTSSVSFGAITEPSSGVFSLQVTPTTVGTLQLQVVAGATLTDAAGNALDTGSAITDDTTLNVTENALPTVDAGPDQAISLTDAVAWSPQEISTAAWYDAADTATISQSSGAVSQWNDKSGNGNHATQTNSAIRPVSGIKTIGGENIIDFDNASQSMDIPIIDVVGKEVWSVFTIDDYTTTNSQLLLGAGGNVQIGINSSSQNLRLWKQSNPYSSDSRSTATLPEATPAFAGWLAHTDTKKFSVNGALEVTGDSYNSGDLSPTYIGRGQYAWMDGAIGEIIITAGTLSTADRERMEGYLAHKWSLQGNLPVNHPYKSAAPGSPTTVAMLNGTVDDADGQALTTMWMKVSGPGTVTFDDASAVDTNATFSEPGTYVLRLTADDGYDQALDEVTITVNEAQSFASWISGYELGGQTAPGDDYDGDGLPNAVENYFGTHPGTYNPGLEITQVMTDGAGDTTFEFSHPISDNPADDLTATYLWSKDLASFHDDGESDGVCTVSFSVGTRADGKVSVSATITGEQPDRLFITVEVE